MKKRVRKKLIVPIVIIIVVIFAGILIYKSYQIKVLFSPEKVLNLTDVGVDSSKGCNNIIVSCYCDGFTRAINPSFASPFPTVNFQGYVWTSYLENGITKSDFNFSFLPNQEGDFYVGCILNGGMTLEQGMDLYINPVRGYQGTAIFQEKYHVYTKNGACSIVPVACNYASDCGSDVCYKGVCTNFAQFPKPKDYCDSSITCSSGKRCEKGACVISAEQVIDSTQHSIDPYVRDKMILDIPELSGFTFMGRWGNPNPSTPTNNMRIDLRYISPVDKDQHSEFSLSVYENNLQDLFLEDQIKQARYVYPDLSLKEINGNKIIGDKTRFWISGNKFIQGWPGNDLGTVTDLVLFDALTNAYLKKYPSTYRGGTQNVGLSILSPMENQIVRGDGSEKLEWTIPEPPVLGKYSVYIRKLDSSSQPIYDWRYFDVDTLAERIDFSNSVNHKYSTVFDFNSLTSTEGNLPLMDGEGKYEIKMRALSLDFDSYSDPVVFEYNPFTEAPVGVSSGMQLQGDQQNSGDQQAAQTNSKPKNIITRVVETVVNFFKNIFS